MFKGTYGTIKTNRRFYKRKIMKASISRFNDYNNKIIKKILYKSKKFLFSSI
jgi:hypothetical protein